MPFPFIERDYFRSRPTLVISRPVGPDSGMLWMLMITSARRGLWPGDVPIGPDHLAYGLPIACNVRTAKIAALQTSAVEDRLGRLPASVMDQVTEVLRANLGWH